MNKECDQDLIDRSSEHDVLHEIYMPVSHLLIVKSQSNYKTTKKKSKRQKRDIQIESLLGALIISLFVSYFPIVLINVVYLFQINIELPDWIQTVSFYTFIFNSAVNPLLCILMKRDLFNKAKFYMKKVCVRSDIDSTQQLWIVFEDEYTFSHKKIHIYVEI